MVRVRSRLIARWLVGALAAALFLGATPLIADSKSGPSNADPALLADAKAHPDAYFPVIVRGASSAAVSIMSVLLPEVGATTADRSDSESRVKRAEAALSASGGARRSLAIVGGASGVLRGSQIVALSRTGLVDRIVRDETFTASWNAGDAAKAVDDAAIETVKAPAAWGAKGLSGKGVTVAVIDSGVADHPDLAGRIVARVDLTGDGSNGDPGGHGTHVAGLIAGDGAASNGKWTGVAPQANIASVRVIDATGHAKLSTIFAGLQWVISNRSTYNIRIANLSFGGAALSGYQNDLLASAVEMLNFSGLTVVVSAGNDGVGSVEHHDAGDRPVRHHRRRGRYEHHRRTEGRQHRDVVVPRADGVRWHRQAGPRGAGPPDRRSARRGQHPRHALSGSAGDGEGLEDRAVLRAVGHLDGRGHRLGCGRALPRAAPVRDAPGSEGAADLHRAAAS